MEGTPPQSAKEVALTRISADKLKANIGDTITIKTIDGDKKYIITAIYQSLYNMILKIGSINKCVNGNAISSAMMMAMIPTKTKRSIW